MAEITASELKEKFDQVLLIDCREPWENEIAAIGGSRLIPMKEMPQHLEELKKESRPIVVYCHHGMRSFNVSNWLTGQGLSNVSSLAGGIDSWSVEIDPSLPRY